MKPVTNLLHLLVGMAFLAIGAHFFLNGIHGGKTRQQRESSMEAHPARSATSDTPGDDFTPSAADGKVDVFSPQDEAAGGDDAVPATSSDSHSFVDHVSAVDTRAPNHFLHKRLSVETFQIFAFEVPPRALRPELRGTFRSVATQRNPDGGGSVEVLLVNEKEFARFINNQPVTATFTSNPSLRGEIDWKLDAPVDNPQKYYLVFRNSSAGQGPSLVDADFTASFE